MIWLSLRLMGSICYSSELMGKSTVAIAFHFLIPRADMLENPRRTGNILPLERLRHEIPSSPTAAGCLLPRNFPSNYRKIIPPKITQKNNIYYYIPGSFMRHHHRTFGGH